MGDTLWNRTGIDIPGMQTAPQPPGYTTGDIGDGLPMAGSAWGAGLAAQGMPIPQAPGFWKNLANNLQAFAGAPGATPSPQSNALMGMGGNLGGGLGLPGGQKSQPQITPAQFNFSAPPAASQSQVVQGQGPNLAQILEQIRGQQPYGAPQQAQAPQGLLMR